MADAQTVERPTDDAVRSLHQFIKIMSRPGDRHHLDTLENLIVAARVPTPPIEVAINYSGAHEMVADAAYTKDCKAGIWRGATDTISADVLVAAIRSYMRDAFAALGTHRDEEEAQRAFAHAHVELMTFARRLNLRVGKAIIGLL
jgi:hypothetical protein